MAEEMKEEVKEETQETVRKETQENAAEESAGPITPDGEEGSDEADTPPGEVKKGLFKKKEKKKDKKDEPCIILGLKKSFQLLTILNAGFTPLRMNRRKTRL